MSPVLSLSTSRFISRRRPVRSHAVGFLPFRPNEPSPKLDAGALSENSESASGWCNEGLESPTADCPPPQLQTPPAPLVGIARLAAQSPAAETKRKSGEKPEYFLLPVKSILNRCESKPGTVRVDCQSLSRVRICVQILLCAVYPRIYGNRWWRI